MPPRPEPRPQLAAALRPYAYVELYELDELVVGNAPKMLAAAGFEPTLPGSNYKPLECPTDFVLKRPWHAVDDGELVVVVVVVELGLDGVRNCCHRQLGKQR